MLLQLVSRMDSFPLEYVYRRLRVAGWIFFILGCLEAGYFNYYPEAYKGLRAFQIVLRFLLFLELEYIAMLGVGANSQKTALLYSGALFAFASSVTSVYSLIAQGGSAAFSILILLFSLPVSLVLVKCQMREQSGQVDGVNSANGGLNAGLAPATATAVPVQAADQVPIVKGANQA